MARHPAPNEVDDTEIRLLRVFRAVVECGGFAAAERELDVGRSTISRHIQELERRLGLRLCRRGRAGFALTEDGAQVHGSALALLQTVDGFRARIQDLRAELAGRLSIGLFDKTVTNPRAQVSAAIGAFRKIAPQVALDIAVDTIQGIEAGLLSGRFDVGIVPIHRSAEQIESFPLFDEDMFLYCGRGHALFGLPAGAPALADLRGHAYAGLAFQSPNMEAMHEFGLRRQAGADDQEAIATLVLSGAFLGFLPDHYAAAFVRAGQLARVERPDCRYLVRFGAAWRRGTPPTRAARAFLQALRNAHARRPRGRRAVHPG